MVRDTLPSQDVSTPQIWNSYLKKYRRYGPDTKAGRTDRLTDRRTDGRTVRLLYVSQSSFGGIKIIRSNNLLQFIHQFTIEFRFRKSLAQEKFKSNLEFRYQIIESSIKFRKCFAKLMIPIALFKTFLI